MRKKSIKKLSLQRETVRTLRDDALAKIHGAQATRTWYPTIISCLLECQTTDCPTTACPQ